MKSTKWWWAMVNHIKSFGLWLDAWKEKIILGPFIWINWPVCNLQWWFRSDLYLEKKENWSELLAKKVIKTWLWKRKDTIKIKVDMCCMYSFLLILYQLTLLPLHEDWMFVLKHQHFHFFLEEKSRPIFLRHVYLSQVSFWRLKSTG